MSRKLKLVPADEDSIWNCRGVKKVKKNSKRKKQLSKSPSKDRFQQLVFHTEKAEQLIDLTSDNQDDLMVTCDIKEDAETLKHESCLSLSPSTEVPETPQSSFGLSTVTTCDDNVSEGLSLATYPNYDKSVSDDKVNFHDELSDRNSEVSNDLFQVVSENEESDRDDKSEVSISRMAESDSKEADNVSDEDDNIETDNITETTENHSLKSADSVTDIKSNDITEEKRQSNLNAIQQLKKANVRQTSLLAFMSNPGKTGKPVERFVNETKSRQESTKSTKILHTFGYQSSETAGSSRKCPFYKWIPGTGFTVDAFRFGSIPGCTHYFLTHFHADHYGGLTRHFKGTIYCSHVTGRLVIQQLRVNESCIHYLDWNTSTLIGEVKVTLLDANHCPGAAMILFELPSGKVYLHTGDFRASDELCQKAEKFRGRIDELYLDTTYCHADYTFPPQRDAIAAVKSLVAKETNPRTLVICGAYQIGKERIFAAIAEVLQCAVFVQPYKRRIINCLEDSSLKAIVTTDAKAQLHVVPMRDLRTDKLCAYLKAQGARYNRILAFKPTGWTHDKSQKSRSQGPVRLISGANGCAIYGVSYSEHSSFLELKNFVQTVRPRRIIPTVNIGSAASREQMNNYFREWLHLD